MRYLELTLLTTGAIVALACAISIFAAAFWWLTAEGRGVLWLRNQELYREWRRISGSGIADASWWINQSHPQAAHALRYLSNLMIGGCEIEGGRLRGELEKAFPSGFIGTQWPASIAGSPVNLEGLADALLRADAQRDENGFTSNPALPAFDEGTRHDLILQALGLESAFVAMDSDCEDEAVTHRYFGDEFTEGECDCTAWTPTRPEGDGWVLLEVYDTEDGPAAMFARRITAAHRKQAERQAQFDRDVTAGYRQTLGDLLADIAEIAAYAEGVGHLPIDGPTPEVLRRLVDAITKLRDQQRPAAIAA
ncbi:hypothetical protein [Cupriavidus sp. YAF13]|uniref:hypothetical protein n=1 Tax=Cupriavidus sp. YAF13 TaxID=3233075 RepID=UPI003F9380A8